jgi:beta-glucanase (GH16 family)
LALSSVAFKAAHAAEKLIFADEFNTLDFETWQHEITLSGAGNWEFEYYTNNRTNSYTRNGILYMKPTLTVDNIGVSQLTNGGMNLWGSTPADQCTSNAFWGCERSSVGNNVINPIQSARLRTVNAFSFKYGRVEVRAKLPKGDWIWPAIWMLPTRNAYGQWPASGEIDIMESRGNANYRDAEGGVDSFGSTLHWGPFFSANAYLKTHKVYKLTNGRNFNDDFHIFGLIWNENSIQTYLDTPTNVILNVDTSANSSFWKLGGWTNSPFNNPWDGAGHNAPFDQKFFLLLNVAVGGTTGYWSNSEPGKPWQDTDPHAVNSFWNNKASWYPTWVGENAAMQIDYIHVYQQA